MQNSLIVMLFFIGLLLGSFFNVCIYRIPRKKSIAFPPSHCPYCSIHLRPFDLVPVASFLYLGGKCRYCGAKISWRYPLVELLTGFTFLVTAYLVGSEFILIKYLFILSVFIVISFIDFEHYLIPNKIISFGFIVGIGLNIWLQDISIIDSVLGLLVGGGLLLLLAVVSKGGMGGGDIKLAALIGFLFGWQNILLALFIGSFIAGVVGGTLILAGIKKREEPIPFGPFIALGTMIILLFGDRLVNWYLAIYGL